jgi:hypothetical protein
MGLGMGMGMGNGDGDGDGEWGRRWGWGMGTGTGTGTGTGIKKAENLTRQKKEREKKTHICTKRSGSVDHIGGAIQRVRSIEEEPRGKHRAIFGTPAGLQVGIPRGLEGKNLQTRYLGQIHDELDRFRGGEARGENKRDLQILRAAGEDREARGGRELAPNLFVEDVDGDGRGEHIHQEVQEPSFLEGGKKNPIGVEAGSQVVNPEGEVDGGAVPVGDPILGESEFCEGGGEKKNNKIFLKLKFIAIPRNFRKSLRKGSSEILSRLWWLDPNFAFSKNSFWKNTQLSRKNKKIY